MINNFNQSQQKAVVLSMMNLKPIKPYLSLVPLAKFEEYMQNQKLAEVINPKGAGLKPTKPIINPVKQSFFQKLEKELGQR